MNELKFLELHGERVAYRDEGSGEVLLLIHGMGGSSDAWRELIPRLAKSYRVVAPALLGNGQSTKARGANQRGWFPRRRWHRPSRPSRAVTIRWVRSRSGCATSSTSWVSRGRRSSATPS